MGLLGSGGDGGVVEVADLGGAEFAVLGVDQLEFNLGVWLDHAETGGLDFRVVQEDLLAVVQGGKAEAFGDHEGLDNAGLCDGTCLGGAQRKTAAEETAGIHTRRLEC